MIEIITYAKPEEPNLLEINIYIHRKLVFSYFANYEEICSIGATFSRAVLYMDTKKDIEENNEISG